jgi:hypothetical protein
VRIRRPAFRPLAVALLALCAIAIVVDHDGWRTALAACVAAACLAASRIRYAAYAGTVLLAVVAVLAVDHRAPAHDDRPPPTAHHRPG